MPLLREKSRFEIFFKAYRQGMLTDVPASKEEGRDSVCIMFSLLFVGRYSAKTDRTLALGDKILHRPRGVAGGGGGSNSEDIALWSGIRIRLCCSIDDKDYQSEEYSQIFLMLAYMLHCGQSSLMYD